MGARTYHAVMAPLILPALIVMSYAMLPAAWGVRAWASTGVLAAFTYVSTPETPLQNQGPFDDLAEAMIGWLLVLASIGVGARVFWALANARSLHLAPAANSTLYRADCLLAAFLGIAAATIATLLLAVALRGSGGGLPLHLAITALASVLVVGSIRLPGRGRPLAVATFLTLACLTFAGATLYPLLILSRAEIIQPGAPRCIRTPDGTTPTTDQLRLLTLPEARPLRPNLVLTVLTENGAEDFRWSYRSSAFRTYDSYSGGPCPT